MTRLAVCSGPGDGPGGLFGPGGLGDRAQAVVSGAVAALPLALHAAALHIARATDHGDLRTASEQLASAIQLVGIDGWPRFVAAAQAHAEMQPPLLVATPIPLASASPVVLARAQPVERHTSPPGSAASP